VFFLKLYQHDVFLLIFLGLPVTTRNAGQFIEITPFIQ